MRINRFIYFMAIAILILSAALAVAGPANAQETISGEAVVIEQGQVVDGDLYAAANQFVLRGTIKGDLHVVGTVITIEPTGVVEGDLGAAGQSITVNGRVEGDARLAGMALLLGERCSIAEDLIGFAYSLVAEPGSKVGGSVTFYGSQALLAGEIGGDLTVGANGVELDGATIGGNVEAMVGQTQQAMPISPFNFMPNMPKIPTVTNGLTVRSGTHIEGDLTYVSGQEFMIPPGAVGGEVTRQVPEVTAEPEAKPQPEPETGAWGWWREHLGNLLALLVVGLLLVWLAPRFVQNASAALQAKPLPALGWGIVAVIAFFGALLAVLAITVVLAVMLGAITLGQLVGPVIFGGLLAGGSLVFTFGMAFAYFSKILVACLVGRLILARLKPAWALKQALSLILGVVVFVLVFSILDAIPTAGGFLSSILNWLVVLFGLGAIWLLGLERFWRKPGRSAPVYTPPPPPAAG